MNIPKSIKIKRSIWKIKTKNHNLDTNKYAGLCIRTSKTILLSPLLRRNELEATLVHEILHAIFPLGIVSTKIEEEIIRGLEKPLHQALKYSTMFKKKELTKRYRKKKKLR